MFYASRRAAELAQIDKFLTETGATICPARYAWGVNAPLPLAEEALRIALFRPKFSDVAIKAIDEARWRRLARRMLWDAFRQGHAAG
jgi:hypothetical protein